MRSRFARRLAAAALALLVLIAIAAVLAWSQRRAAMHWWALRELARFGFVAASVEVSRFDAGRLELRNLRSADGALSVAEVDADFGLGDLRLGRVRALRVSGVRLSGEIGPEGWRLGGLESLGAGGGEPPARAGLRLPSLPTSQLVVKDARAEIATPRGPLSADLSVNAHDTNGRIEARGDLVLDHALAKGTAQLELAGSESDFGGAAALGLQLAKGNGLGLPVSSGTLALAALLESRGGELTISLSPGPFALAIGRGKKPLRLEGSTPQAKLRKQLGDDAPVSLEASGGELRVPTLALVARGFDIDTRIGGSLGDLSGRITVRELEDTKRPARATPLALTAKLEPRGQALGFDLRATDPKKRVAIRAVGSFHPETGKADADLRVEPVRFAKDGLQPAQLVPALAAYATAVAGSIEANGRARWSKGRAKLTLDLAARDLSFDTPHAQVEGMNGTLRVLGPAPYSTPEGQLVSIARIGFGLDLVDGVVGGRLRPDGVIVIDKAEWHTLGGVVRTAGSVDPGASQQQIVLEAADLELAQLLALVNLEGLSGEGKLDGKLPVTRRSDAIEIRGGILKARPGGMLRYHPAAGVAGLAGSGQGMALLLGAFENMTYDVLELTLDGDANGLMQLGLRVHGSNPEFQDGRPVHYNLNVEARLADILRQSVAAYRIPQVIEERLQHFGAPQSSPAQ
jgi:hypothetical protein